VSLQRRLLVFLLLCAPVVWGVALIVSASRARHEVNELYDTEIIRLARQVQATLPGLGVSGAVLSEPVPSGGAADMRDLAIAVWNGEGKLLLSDREGVQLPRRADAAGFVDLTLGSDAWRVYYLQSARGTWLVAAGQRVYERDELVKDLVSSQLLPWLLVLPVLLLAMAWAVRQALAPVRTLTADLQRRGADDLQKVPTALIPVELGPLFAAMNGLFARIESTLARERRFTADAAHELRTPLAVLRAQWDVLSRSREEGERSRAFAKLGAGLDRMDRMVEQLLALSRVDAAERPAQGEPVEWKQVVERVVSDLLPLAERRRIELACDWPGEGAPAFAVRGDADLLTLLLRNLVDNAVRYAPEGSEVTLHFSAEGLDVENAGPPLPAETLAHLGERFHRAAGQAESGSGLGISIAQRIAALHGLALRYRARADGSGVVAELRRLSVP
jgi:two-component system sensor histidine kinase QseC